MLISHQKNVNATDDTILCCRHGLCPVTCKAQASNDSLTTVFMGPFVPTTAISFRVKKFK